VAPIFPTTSLTSTATHPWPEPAQAIVGRNALEIAPTEAQTEEEIAAVAVAVPVAAAEVVVAAAPDVEAAAVSAAATAAADATNHESNGGTGVPPLQAERSSAVLKKPR